MVAKSLPDRWAAFDPGESVGYTVYRGSKIHRAGTAEAAFFVEALAAALGVQGASVREPEDEELVRRLRGCQLLVVEDWRLYPWMLTNGALAWDECRTARLIGAIEFIADQAGVGIEMQGAKIKDAAEAAGAQDLFLRPLDENRHANDAIRHGAYYAAMRGEGLAWE